MPVLAGQRGFQGITGLYCAAVLASKRFDRGSSNLVGERIELVGSSTTIAKFRSRPEEGGVDHFHCPHAREGRGGDGAGGRREVGGFARRQ